MTYALAERNTVPATTPTPGESPPTPGPGRYRIRTSKGTRDELAALLGRIKAARPARRVTYDRLYRAIAAVAAAEPRRLAFEVRGTAGRPRERRSINAVHRTQPETDAAVLGLQRRLMTEVGARYSHDDVIAAATRVAGAFFDDLLRHLDEVTR